MPDTFPEEAPFFTIFRRLARLLFGAFLMSVLTVTASAQAVHEPARGTAERSEILNAVRPMLEARVGPPVEFVVNWMRSGSGWAFVVLSPQRPGGAPIDLFQTTYSEQAEYMDGATTFALLRFQYDRWNLIDFAVGPTDAFWHGDPLYARLPPGLVR
ncbi:hypothetical protein [uncultured Roseibium sp.]|uniref:hypothetical protein n=1 Tax=uncultured Roseibium sp. TaxID=1936171 RepID=UPI002633635F|nr:hypothetical protein [uncultured Roseibium sp.]